MTCRPGHAPKWPDFEPGNAVALSHGGYSPAAIDERAVEVRHHLFELAPWLNDDPTYVIQVARFVRVEARAQLLGDAIASKAADKGILSVGARLLEAATAADRLAARLADDLGLSPLGRARLKTTVAAGELGEASLVERLAVAAKTRTQDRESIDRQLRARRRAGGRVSDTQKPIGKVGNLTRDPELRF